jgi:hypothetical protein
MGVKRPFHAVDSPIGHAVDSPIGEVGASVDDRYVHSVRHEQDKPE